MRIQLFLAGFVCFASLLPDGLPSQPAEAPPPTLRIGSWNIEWLGSKDKRPDQPDPDFIAQYLAGSGVDVLGLNEVGQNIETEEGWGNRTLAEALRLLSERTDGDWRHLLFFKENRSEREQLVGVAWNAKRVRRVGDPFRLPVRRRPQAGEQWHRHPWGVKFSTGVGKTDFVLIPLHMKSNRGGFEQTSQQRGNEATSLIRALGALQNFFSDDDIVPLGDTNVLREDELALRRFAGNGFRDLNGGKLMTWIRSAEYAAAPFDRIFVPDDQPEFAGCVQRVVTENPLGSEEAFRARLSDHYLIVTDIKILADDD